MDKLITVVLAFLTCIPSALTGVIVFGEPMSVMTAAGILCVLAGVYILR